MEHYDKEQIQHTHILYNYSIAYVHGYYMFCIGCPDKKITWGGEGGGRVLLLRVVIWVLMVS